MQAVHPPASEIGAEPLYTAYAEWSAARARGDDHAAGAIAVQTVLDRFGWNAEAEISIRRLGGSWLSATLRQAMESLAPLDLARCLREPRRQVQELLRRSIYLQHTAFLVRLDHDRPAEEPGAVDHAAEKIAADLELEGLAHNCLHDRPHWIDIDLAKLPAAAALRKQEA